MPIVEFAVAADASSPSALFVTSNYDGFSATTPGIQLRPMQQLLIRKGPDNRKAPMRKDPGYSWKKTNYQKAQLYNTFLKRCQPPNTEAVTPQELVKFFSKVEYNSNYIVRLAFSLYNGVNRTVHTMCLFLLSEYVHQRALKLKDSPRLPQETADAVKKLIAAKTDCSETSSVRPLFGAGSRLQSELLANDMSVKMFVQVDSLHRLLTLGVNEDLLSEVASDSVLEHLYTFGSLAFYVRGVDQNIRQVTVEDFPQDRGLEWNAKVVACVRRQADVIASTRLVKFLFKHDSLQEDFDRNYPPLVPIR